MVYWLLNPRWYYSIINLLFYSRSNELATISVKLWGINKCVIIIIQILDIFNLALSTSAADEYNIIKLSA